MNTGMHTGRTPHKMKTEIRVMLLQVKEFQRFPANFQQPGERLEEEPSSHPSAGTKPADASVLDFRPPEL